MTNIIIFPSKEEREERKVKAISEALNARLNINIDALNRFLSEKYENRDLLRMNNYVDKLKDNLDD